jgi:Fe-S cluster assembly protein SufD
MADETKTGGSVTSASRPSPTPALAGSSALSASVTVNEPGAGDRLAGPGTGRAVSQPTDARTERHASFDPADFPALTGREEDWRFTPLKRLRGLHENPTADGKVSTDVVAPDGVRVEVVGRDDARLGKAGMPVDRAAALAFANFQQATVITVPKETELTQPIRVDLHGEGGTAFGHVQIAVEPFAKAVVVLDYQGSATYSENVEFIVGDSAKLTVVALQDWAADAVHLSQQQTKLGRDAKFTSVNVAFGGDLVRLVPQVVYTAPGGDAELLGVYFADAGQHLEARLFVDHSVPNCKSRVTYKGALQGEDAHTVWIGDVLIRAAAEQTDTYELNRNLLLSDGARADSVPNLEIETGEIAGAGHASATGRFDDEQLFYLQARGIPENEARRLVVRGFFADVIGKIGIDELEERLMAKVESELSLTMLAESGAGSEGASA